VLCALRGAEWRCRRAVPLERFADWWGGCVGVLRCLADWGAGAEECGRWAAVYVLFACCLLPAACCLLPAACCLLPAADL
jgi:hypothetical protein